MSESFLYGSPDPQNIRLIAVDLDGTLLNSRKELPARFPEALAELRRRAIQLVIASGRQHFNLLKLFAAQCRDLLYISENGAMIATCDQVLQIDALPRDVVRATIIEARQLGGSPVLCTPEGAFIDSTYPGFFETAHIYCEKLTIIPDLLAMIDLVKVCKIAIYSAAAENQVLPALRHKLPDQHVTLSGADWVDVMNLTANKGNAVKFLQHHFNLKSEQLMAFGDYLNDQEMLQYCYWSFAMANAHRDLKKFSRFEAPSNEDNGVLKTWHKYLNLNIL